MLTKKLYLEFVCKQRYDLILKLDLLKFFILLSNNKKMNEPLDWGNSMFLYCKM